MDSRKILAVGSSVIGGALLGLFWGDEIGAAIGAVFGLVVGIKASSSSGRNHGEEE